MRPTVGFISPAAQLGGAEQFLVDLAAALPREDVLSRAYLACEGPLEDVLRERGVPVSVLRWPAELLRLGDSPDVDKRAWFADLARLPTRLVPTVQGLARILRRDGVDLVQTNGIKAELLAGWLPLRRPRVWYLQDFLGRRRLAPKLLALSPRRPRWTWTATRPVLDDAISIFPWLEGRSDVLPMTFDMERWPVTPARRDALESAPGTLRVGLIATFAPWKGHHVFLDAASRVLRERTDVHFYIVGGQIYDTAKRAREAYVAGVAERAARPDLAGRVTLTGFRRDVPDVVASLDVVVHCSTAPEPFGRTIVEALAMGRPVIAADAGGVREIVTPGENGLLVPPSDAAALAAAIGSLLRDRERRAALAAAGPPSVRTRFSSETVARAAAARYRALLGLRAIVGSGATA